MKKFSFAFLVFACAFLLAQNAVFAARQISNIDFVLNPTTLKFTPSTVSQTFTVSLSDDPTALEGRTGNLRFRLGYNRKQFSSDLNKRRVFTIPYANGIVLESDPITLTYKDVNGLAAFAEETSSKINIRVPKKQRKRFKLKNFRTDVTLAPVSTKDISGEAVVPANSSNANSSLRARIRTNQINDDDDELDRVAIGAGITVRLIKVDANGTELEEIASTATDSSGKFSFSDIPDDCDYIVVVETGLENDTQLRAFIPVGFEIDDDDINVDPLSDFIYSQMKTDGLIGGFNSDEYDRLEQGLRNMGVTYEQSIVETLEALVTKLERVFDNMASYVVANDAGDNGSGSNGQPLSPSQNGTALESALETYGDYFFIFYDTDMVAPLTSSVNSNNLTFSPSNSTSLEIGEARISKPDFAGTLYLSGAPILVAENRWEVHGNDGNFDGSDQNNDSGENIDPLNTNGDISLPAENGDVIEPPQDPDTNTPSDPNAPVEGSISCDPNSQFFDANFCSDKGNQPPSCIEGTIEFNQQTCDESLANGDQNNDGQGPDASPDQGGGNDCQDCGDGGPSFATLTGSIGRPRFGRGELAEFIATTDANGVITFVEPGETEISDFDSSVGYRSEAIVTNLYPVGDDMYLASNPGSDVDFDTATFQNLAQRYFMGLSAIMQQSDVSVTDFNSNYGLISFETNYDSESIRSGSSVGNVTVTGDDINATLSLFQLENRSDDGGSTYSVTQETVSNLGGEAKIQINRGKMNFRFTDGGPGEESDGPELFEGYISSDAEKFVLVDAVDEITRRNNNGGARFRDGDRELDYSQRSFYVGVRKGTNEPELDGQSYRLFSMEVAFPNSNGGVAYKYVDPESATMTFSSSSVTFSDMVNTTLTRASTDDAISTVTSSVNAFSGSTSYSLGDGGISFTVGNYQCLGFVSSDESIIIFRATDTTNNSVAMYVGIAK